MRISTEPRIVPLRSLRGSGPSERIPGLHGRTVLSSGGSRIGEVEELLVDADSGEVVYLDVALDPNLSALRREQSWSSAPLANEEKLPGGVRLSNANRLHDVNPANERRPTGERPGLRQEAAGFAGAQRPPEGRPAPGDERCHILVPFRYAWFNEAGDEVFVEGLRSQDTGELPAYQGTVSPEMEAALERWFGRGFVPGRR